jgi:hypothetical protein
MGEESGLSSNPIAKILLRNPLIAWTVALIALIGAVLNFSTSAWDNAEKVYSRIFPNAETIRLTNKAADLGIMVAQAAFRPLMAEADSRHNAVQGYMEKFKDHRSHIDGYIEDMKLPARLKGADYSSKKWNDVSEAANLLTISIGDVGGRPASDQFRFQYWLETAENMIKYRSYMNTPDKELQAAFDKLDSIRPRGIEMAPRTSHEFCQYYVKYSILGSSPDVKQLSEQRCSDQY